MVAVMPSAFVVELKWAWTAGGSANNSKPKMGVKFFAYRKYCDCVYENTCA
jgi:hypothetical protein